MCIKYMMIDANAAITLLEKRLEKFFKLWTGFEPTTIASNTVFPSYMLVKSVLDSLL